MAIWMHIQSQSSSSSSSSWRTGSRAECRVQATKGPLKASCLRPSRLFCLITCARRMSLTCINTQNNELYYRRTTVKQTPQRQPQEHQHTSSSEETSIGGASSIAGRSLSRMSLPLTCTGVFLQLELSVLYFLQPMYFWKRCEQTLEPNSWRSYSSYKKPPVQVRGRDMRERERSAIAERAPPIDDLWTRLSKSKELSCERCEQRLEPNSSSVQANPINRPLSRIVPSFKPFSSSISRASKRLPPLRPNGSSLGFRAVSPDDRKYQR